MIKTSHNVIVRSKSGRLHVTRSGFNGTVKIEKVRPYNGTVEDGIKLTDDEARELFNSLGEMFKELKRWNG